MKPETTAIDSNEAGPRVDLIQRIKKVMCDFVGVRTPEQALEVSLRYAGYSLPPDNTEAEVDALFPERAELSPMIVRAMSGYRAQQKSPSIVDYAFGSVASEASHLARYTTDPTQDEDEMDVVYNLFEQVRLYSLEQAKALAKAKKEEFLGEVSKLSEGGRYIVIHGAATPPANAFWDILADFDSSLGVLHAQRLQQQNFYRIPLDLWVQFCDRHFPEACAIANTSTQVQVVLGE
jgi:hypothetical protein